MEITPTPSHNLLTGSVMTDDGPVHTGLESYYRFCQPDPNRGVTCSVDSGQRGHLRLQVVPTGNPDNPWLRATIKEIAPGTRELLIYPSPRLTHVWDFKKDRTNWPAAGLLNASAVPTDTAGSYTTSGFLGTFAIRAGDAGDSFGTFYKPENGIHRSPEDAIYKSGAGMTRSYVDVVPDVILRSPLGQCVATCKTCITECPECGRCVGASCKQSIGAWLAACPTCLDRLKPGAIYTNPSDFRNALSVPGDTWKNFNPGGLFAVPTLAGKLGIFGPKGVVSLVPDSFSKAFAGSLKSLTKRYVAPTEFFAASLSPSATSSVRRIPGAFISPDATRIEDTLQFAARGYALGIEQCDAEPVGNAQEYRVRLPAGSVLSQTALGTLGGQLKLNDGVKVQTASGGYAAIVSVQGGVYMGADAKAGNLFGDGPVELRNRARVEGSLKTSGSVTKQPDSVVTGTTSTLSSLAPLDEVAWTVRFPSANQGNRMVEPDLTLPLAPGAFGTVNVKSRAKLSLTRGTYYFQSLTVEPQAVLDLDNRTGAIYVYVGSGLTFRGSLSSRATTANVLFGVFGSQPVNFLDSPFNATLVAPNAAVVLGSVSQGHTGSYFAKSLEVGAWTNVKLRPFTRTDCDEAGGCLGGWETCRSTRLPGDPLVTLSAVPREGYVPVMSSALDALFVVGGRHATSHAELGDVVVHRFETGETFTLAVPGLLLGKVHAATVAFDDASLWVLDELGAELRLTRVDPIGRRAKIVWHGAAQAGTDGQWLSLDPSGNVLLSATKLSGSFSVLRVVSTPFVFGSERFEYVHGAAGTLMASPLVEDGGLTYVLEGAGARLVRPASTAANRLGLRSSCTPSLRRTRAWAVPTTSCACRSCTGPARGAAYQDRARASIPSPRRRPST